jgi:hypothetical protein
MSAEQLKSEHLAAAGVIVTCQDTITSEYYLLFGVTPNNSLCHFHGFNDEAKDEPYLKSAIITAAREYAEECLEVVGDEATILTALQHNDYSVQIWPEASYNVRGYLIFMGNLGAKSRQAVKQRYQNLLLNPSLKKYQKENKAVVWVKARDFYDAVKACNTSHILVPIENETKRMYLRGWLTSWFIGMMDKTKTSNGSGTRVFLNMCRKKNYTIPIKSFQEL